MSMVMLSIFMVVAAEHAMGMRMMLVMLFQAGMSVGFMAAIMKFVPGFMIGLVREAIILG